MKILGYARTYEEVGINTSLNSILKFCEENGPFDGIFGFSMGAAVIARFLSTPGKQFDEARKSLKFAAFFAGCIPPPESDVKLFKTNFLNPEPNFLLPDFIHTFHCYGKNDETITPEDSQALADAFSERNLLKNNENLAKNEVFVHGGGHLMPAEARRPFKEFLASFAEP